MSLASTLGRRTVSLILQEPLLWPMIFAFIDSPPLAPLILALPPSAGRSVEGEAATSTASPSLGCHRPHTEPHCPPLSPTRPAVCGAAPGVCRKDAVTSRPPSSAAWGRIYVSRVETFHTLTPRATVTPTLYHSAQHTHTAGHAHDISLNRERFDTSSVM